MTDPVISQHDPDTTASTVFSAELSTINSQLLNHGWTQRPLDLSSLSTKDHNEVVSVLFDLLGSSVSNVNNLEAMATRHRTLQYEYERIQKSNNSLKVVNTKLQQETNGWKVRCTEIEKRLNIEEAKMKELREEVQRGRKALEGVRVAAQHEGKKIQSKLDKALSQLSKQSETPQPKSSGLVLLNPIPAGRIQPISSTSSPLLEQTLKDLTEIRESLQEETEAFRTVVVSTGNALREALAASQGKEPPARLMQSQFFTLNTTQLRHSHLSTSTFQSHSSTSHPSIANTRLQSLITEIRNKLLDDAPPPVPVLIDGMYAPTPEEVEEQKRVERERERIKGDLEDRIKDLEVELICARKKEEESRRVVDDMARKELEAATAKGDMEGILAKQLDLIEIERKAMKEGKERIERERKQLEIEKQTFIEERKQSELDAILSMIPSTSHSQPHLDDSPESQGEQDQEFGLSMNIPSSPGPSTYHHPHLPSSPSPLSPLPHGKIRTPKAKSQHTVTSNRRKSIKTPLSRLVLEKAVRQQARESGSNVLGVERGRKTNLVSSTAGRGMSPRKGKERSVSGLGLGVPSKAFMGGGMGGKARSSSGSSSSSSTSKGVGVTPITTSTLRPSSGAGAASLRSSMTASTSATRKVDLSKVGGIGPMAAKRAKGVWR
ncbi:hypothetical protein I302_104856 [Kwoniella bestiolae CBS 10118]|uniref:Afadin and alpha-actinin-binding-domain-containing protein n=1 Tax=Kwoniella bestiolae CBS 10118 TaxID=1296100 RepID=A0A1B9FRJ8_9TREE|nr:hypothetical protein I302_09074 [Kwoniella bestiolae CBS 10118]OCF21397.1 hypothetical protein I302_09074 [Kwoniella bestiolae CBS 10118]